MGRGGGREKKKRSCERVKRATVGIHPPCPIITCDTGNFARAGLDFECVMIEYGMRAGTYTLHERGMMVRMVDEKFFDKT